MACDVVAQLQAQPKLGIDGVQQFDTDLHGLGANAVAGDDDDVHVHSLGFEVGILDQFFKLDRLAAHIFCKLSRRVARHVQVIGFKP